MARPSKFDRSEALGTAMTEVWRDGYQAASVQRLSSVLGITRSSFYNAFGSREALLFEIVARYRAALPPPPRPGARAPVLPRLAEFVRALCRFQAEHGWCGCLIANGIAELGPGDAPVAALLESALRESVAGFEALLCEAQARGELDADADPAVLALACQSLITGLSVLGKALRDEEALWKVARTTLRALKLDGASRKPRRAPTRKT